MSDREMGNRTPVMESEKTSGLKIGILSGNTIFSLFTAQSLHPPLLVSVQKG